MGNLFGQIEKFEKMFTYNIVIFRTVREHPSKLDIMELAQADRAHDSTIEDVGPVGCSHREDGLLPCQARHGVGIFNKGDAGRCLMCLTKNDC
jgi:hypothetical protein